MQDTWDAIEARADELAGVFLDLTVKTSGTDLTLGRARRRGLPVPRAGPRTATSGDRRERLAKDHRSSARSCTPSSTGGNIDEDAPDDLLALFREVLEEAADATA